MITYGSDCTGIDCILLALEQLVRLHYVFCSDNNKNCREMIKANHNPMIIYDNVKRDDQPKQVDFYTAGFPCPSWSIQGLRKGFNDDRGQIFFDVFKYIKERQPKVAVLENVYGLINHDKGNSFKKIINMLENIGVYNISWDIMSPLDYNFPQSRRRVFIVCIRKDVQKKPMVFPTKVPLTTKASSLLSNHTYVDNTKITPSEKKWMANAFKKQKYLDQSKLDNEYYFGDIATGFLHWRKEVCPCLTWRRSTFFISKLNRRLTTEEIARFQGIPENRIKVVVSPKQYECMIGNGIHVGVAKLLMKNILKSVDLKKK